MVLKMQKKLGAILIAGIVYSSMSQADSLFSNSTNNASTNTPTNNVVVPPIIPDSSSGSSGDSISKSLSSSKLPSGGFGSAQELSINQDQSTARRNPKSQVFDFFQRNVLIRTGLNLSSYGSDLFNVPDSFSPSQNIPVPAGYAVGPGDRIQIQVWGAVDANIDSNVAPDGSVFIPKVGSIPVTGVKAGNLDRYLTQKIGKSFKNFSISSNISKVRSIQVTVAGYASQPGTYQLSSLSTLTNAIFAVGGPSPIGSLRKVELKRNGRIITTFDMYDVLLKGDDSKDLHLLPGDTIYFPPVGPRVAIYEGVKQPAIYEVTEKDKLENLVKYAGGYTFDGKHDKVILETINQNKQISANTYSLQQALGMSLSDGEIIHFFTATNTYVNSVAVVGSVANPTRMGYRSGMTVRDLIPNKEALLTSSYWNSYAYNTYGKDNYITQLGVEKLNNLAQKDNKIKLGSDLKDSGSSEQNTNDTFIIGDNVLNAGPLRIPEANINWSYAVIMRLDPKDFQVHLIPFNLSKAIAGDSANNLRLQPGDIINVVSSKDVRTSISQKTSYVFIDGEVMAPGVYEVPYGATLKDIINQAGGVSSNAYLFGLELDRESVRKRQQAALNQMLDQAQQNIYTQSAVMAGSSTQASQIQAQQFAMQQQQAFIDKMRKIKPAGRIVLGLKNSQVAMNDIPDMPLENGDTVYVPAKPGVVDVVGQVFNPASFAYNDKYTIAKYIDMAGTETQFADTSYEYVLRADGTLYSRQQAGWFGGFSNRNLNPGDVIIVPQQIQYGAAMQNLLNWTQILSNFGTGAAAIAVFR
jgi:protein involved in polysaccharide export with SLBB domain